METLVLKGLDVAGDYLEDRQPVDRDCFELWVTLSIGSSDENGSTLYELCICTPKWLERRFEKCANKKKDVQWGRHLLIVASFEPETIKLAIKQKLQEIVDRHPNDNGVELSKKFARYAHWEYEDFDSSS
jgi:hypothetical protein